MSDSLERERLRVGDLVLDVAEGTVARAGAVLALPPRTFHLLLALARHYPNHVRRTELLQTVWPQEIVTDQTLSHRILLLRRALGDESAKPRYIAADRGWGYRLLVPVERLAAGAPPPAPPVRRAPRIALGAAAALLAAGGLALIAPAARGRSPWSMDPGKRVAVLPYGPASGDAARDFLGGHLRDQIAGALAAEKLGIEPGAGAGPRPDGRLEVSLTGEGERLTVSLKLTRPESLRVLWEHRFTGSPYEIFAAEEQLVSEALVRTRRGLDLLERPARPARAEVARLCLRGEWFVRSWQGPSLRQAVDAYQRALVLDDTNGRAYSGLAIAYVTLAWLSELPPREAADPARAAAGQALREAPQLASAHEAWGLVELAFGSDLAAAERSLSRALELGRDDPLLLAMYALFLQATGRPDASLPLLREAEELDPYAALVPYLVGRAHHLARRCGAALGAFTRALELEPYLVPADLALAHCHSEMGQGEQALGALLRARSLAGAEPQALEALRRGHASRQLPGLWAALCEMAEKGSADPVQTAIACTRGGRIPLALKWLEDAAQQRAPGLLFARQEPGFDALRALPAFQAALDESGLPLPRP